ncbi:MAG TPA: helix-turn-helix domain-containing protein [Terriglobales bacterium]|nr:helix-turn-helix domain-containing protein [Terriglobales bacterium]
MTWLTAQAAASYLRVSTRVVLRWAKKGQLPAYRLSGTRRCTWRFRAEDLDRHLVAQCPPLPVRSETEPK